MVYGLLGFGRLRSRDHCGIAYDVEFVLQIREDSLCLREPGEPFRAICSAFLLRAVGSQVIPDGHYELHTVDGDTHYLQKHQGSWCYLGAASQEI